MKAADHREGCHSRMADGELAGDLMTPCERHGGR